MTSIYFPECSECEGVYSCVGCSLPLSGPLVNNSFAQFLRCRSCEESIVIVPDGEESSLLAVTSLLNERGGYELVEHNDCGGIFKLQRNEALSQDYCDEYDVSTNDPQSPEEEWIKAWPPLKHSSHLLALMGKKQAATRKRIFKTFVTLEAIFRQIHDFTIQIRVWDFVRDKMNESVEEIAEDIKRSNSYASREFRDVYNKLVKMYLREVEDKRNRGKGV